MDNDRKSAKLISELDRSHGATVDLIARVTRREERVSRTGSPYVTLFLEDRSATLRAQLWNDGYVGPEVAVSDVLHVHGVWQHIGEQWFLKVRAAEYATSYSPIRLIPLSSCPHPDIPERLELLVDRLTVPALRDFVEALFNDGDLREAFLHAPASRHHHHSHPGGLAEHSLECAEIVAGLPLFSVEERELGGVAALCHDIGKVWTHSGRRRSVLDHDLIVLEVLAPFLKGLEAQWGEGSDMLRHLLTCHAKGEGHRRMVVEEAVRFADRVSSGCDAQRQAFDGLPDWRACASFGNRWYYRSKCR